uniref:Uncharacterized protein n=1 Tax=Oncorhynchus mykiss TaxID=8022 RepID=A0A8C7LZS0_ONCMY
VTEDHSLGNGDGSVDITEGCELLVLIIAEHVILLDGVQSLLFTFQLDDVGQHLTFIWQHSAWENSPLDPDALVLVTLCGNHDVSLVQDEDADLLGVDDLQCPDDNLLLNVLTLTFIATNGICQFDLRIEFPHLFNDFTSLQS